MNLKILFSLAIFASFLTVNGLAQLPPVTICLGVDTTICQTQSVTINNCTTGGGSGALNMTAPIGVSLSDDSWSAAVPIGFTFSYYGTNYTQCVIGSNGIVSFKLSNAGGYCPWSLPAGTTIPTAGLAGASNSAMGLYTDMNPVNSNSGPIQYQTIGTAPNRIFIVLYKGVTAFSCTSSCSYTAFLFYEGTNIIEYHIGSKQDCVNWNGGRAIQGVQNLSNNIATATPGRNNTIWTAAQDGKRFSPTSATNTNAYTVSTIPYMNVTSGGTAGTGLSWRSTLNQTFPYNGGSLTIPSVPSGTTGYFLIGTSCGVSIGSVSDTTFLTRSVASVTTTTIPDTCGGGNGVITATSGVNGPYTFSWTN
ncbi:MAG: gliding motility-associated C-terminal domain-containing protein, partial [Bacteroidota bacterium]